MSSWARRFWSQVRHCPYSETSRCVKRSVLVVSFACHNFASYYSIVSDFGLLPFGRDPDCREIVVLSSSNTLIIICDANFPEVLDRTLLQYWELSHPIENQWLKDYLLFRTRIDSSPIYSTASSLSLGLNWPNIVKAICRFVIFDTIIESFVLLMQIVLEIVIGDVRQSSSKLYVQNVEVHLWIKINTDIDA